MKQNGTYGLRDEACLSPTISVTNSRIGGPFQGVEAFACFSLPVCGLGQKDICTHSEYRLGLVVTLTRCRKHSNCHRRRKTFVLNASKTLSHRPSLRRQEIVSSGFRRGQVNCKMPQNVNNNDRYPHTYLTWFGQILLCLG